jgi:putative transposase
VLIKGVDKRLKQILVEVAKERQVDPQYGIHKVVKQMKGRSSRFLRDEFPWLKSRLPTLWTNSYFVSTVGGAPLAVIKQYIENQKSV